MFRVTKNGDTVEFFSSDIEVKNWIENQIEKNENLNPKLIFSSKVEKGLEIIVYQYYTLYQEVFVIQYEGI